MRKGRERGQGDRKREVGSSVWERGAGGNDPEGLNPSGVEGGGTNQKEKIMRKRKTLVGTRKKEQKKSRRLVRAGFQGGVDSGGKKGRNPF